MLSWYKEPSPVVQKVSWFLPGVWIAVKTLFRTLTPEGTGIALIMSVADVLCFELLIFFFCFLLLRLGPNPRRPEWKKVVFYVNISLLPLVVADIAIPLAQNVAYAQFPNLSGDHSFAALAAATSPPAYGFVAIGQFTWQVICTLAFLPLFIVGIKRSFGMRWHVVIPFAVTIAVICWALGTVVSGVLTKF